MISDKLRLVVEKYTFKSSEKEFKVTISIGGTLFKKGETIQELIARADSYMYESKETGRNKVTVK